MAAKYWYPPPESISPYAGGPQPTDYAPPQAYPPTGANSPPPAGYADVEAGGGAGKPPPIRVLYVLYVEVGGGVVFAFLFVRLHPCCPSGCLMGLLILVGDRVRDCDVTNPYLTGVRMVDRDIREVFDQ
ncbi:unnamed protein product [Closterium sp. NIES-53]